MSFSLALFLSESSSSSELFVQPSDSGIVLKKVPQCLQLGLHGANFML